MKAITVEPKKPGSARFASFRSRDVREGSAAWLKPSPSSAFRKNDEEIVEGKYGWAWRRRQERLVLGHRCLGRVIDPAASRVHSGKATWWSDTPPDPVPYPNCAVGDRDMCTNGQYTDAGSKRSTASCRNAGAADQYLIKVDPSLGILGVLLKPMTVITKAIEQVFLAGRRSSGSQDHAGDRRAAIGLLAALRLVCET